MTPSPTSSISRWRTRGTYAIAVLALMFLSACGGSTDGDDPGTASPTANPTAPGPGPGGGPDQAAILECLRAAGIDVPTPTATPSGLPSGMPTGRPSGMPTGRPSGMPSNGPGGQFDDPKVREALEACGISLPTAQPSP